MHSQLTQIVAQQHVTDLRRAVDHDRLARAATTANRSDAPTAGRTVAAAPVTLMRRLRRHLAHMHPAAR